MKEQNENFDSTQDRSKEDRYPSRIMKRKMEFLKKDDISENPSFESSQNKKLFLLTYNHQNFNENTVYYFVISEQEARMLFNKDFPKDKLDFIEEIQNNKIFAITSDYQSFGEKTVTYITESKESALEMYESEYPGKKADLVREVKSSNNIKINNSYQEDINESKSNDFDNSQLVGGIFLALLLGVFIFFLLDDSSNDSGAIVAAQSYVEEILLSPSSADFPWFDTSVTELSENRYHVQSYVDSENGFGSTVRTYWEVELIYQGDDTWVLESISSY